MTDRSRGTIAGVLLGAAAFALFGGVARNGFVNFDDGTYLLNNPRMQSGMSLESLAWAFTSFDAANWHPLTWLSHLLDVQLFGMWPAGHHITSALLHAANAALLLLALHRSTGALGRSAFVAALFALHPLRVESVAWAAERKDVLSGLFWMLGLLAYQRYLQRPGAVRYLALVGVIALALLSKPMVVTFPLVLLLLDVWPFGRLAKSAATGSAPSGRARTLVRILAEKIPLLAMSAAASVVTYRAQRGGGAVALEESFHAAARYSNILVSYAWYLKKFFIPLDLAVYYPMSQRAIPAGTIVAAALLLAALSWLALSWPRRRPFLALGWLWFLGTLVPVVGIVKTGGQSYADRYTYLPLIGIAIAVTWQGAEALRRFPRLRTTAAVLTVLPLAVLTVRQVDYWRDSAVLWQRALQVTGENWLASINYAVALMEQGRDDEARTLLIEAQSKSPDPKIPVNLGLISERRGDVAEAGKWYALAIAKAPPSAEAHYGLGNVLSRQGRYEEAIREYREAVRLIPGYSEAWNNLAVLLARLGRLEEASRNYQEAVRANPGNPEAHNNYGVDLFRRGLAVEAMREYRESLRLRPDYVAPALNLADALSAQGRRDEARQWYREALRLNPGSARARAGLAAAP